MDGYRYACMHAGGRGGRERGKGEGGKEGSRTVWCWAGGGIGTGVGSEADVVGW